MALLKSYAKINLSLSVKRKLINGLHDIESIFCQIDLFDKIRIKKLIYGKADKVSFEGPFSANIKNSNNSIKKLLILMRKNKLISNFYSVQVFKKIPVFAGLGGGTSNAATILKFLYKEKTIEKKLLKKMVNCVGSDLRLFFQKQGYLKNINSVDKLSKKHKLYFVVAYPNIRCSTKEVYSRVNKFSSKKFFSQKELKNKNKFIEKISKKGNDLQLIVEKKYPVITGLLHNIRVKRGCYLSKMTGSGSACYGLFKNENCSKAALKSLRKIYPKFWFSIAKTI